MPHQHSKILNILETRNKKKNFNCKTTKNHTQNGREHKINTSVETNVTTVNSKKKSNKQQKLKEKKTNQLSYDETILIHTK